MKVLKKIGRAFVQHINLVLLILIVLQCILFIHGSFSGTYARRAYEKQKIENQMQIEKAETDKALAILEAEKEAEVLRIKNGADNTEDRP